MLAHNNIISPDCQRSRHQQEPENFRKIIPKIWLFHRNLLYTRKCSVYTFNMKIFLVLFLFFNDISAIASEESFLSNVNSSAAALSESASFTGSSEKVRSYDTVVTAVKTDQAGTLYMEFSPDGTNWDSSLSFAVAANTNEIHRLSITRPYFRASFTNGSVAQTFFRLTTLFGSQGQLTSTLNSMIQADADALVVRPMSEETATARGLISGNSYVNKYGSNSDVDAAEDIWNVGGDYTGWPAAAEAIEVLSSSAADTAAGTGARTVKIFGLDANYALQEETVTLNGVTPVDTVGTYLRVYRAFVVTAGSGTTNAGTITIRHTTTTANVFCQITIGIGQTQQTNYTIPAGYTGYLIGYQSQIFDTTANRSTIAIKYREFGGSVRMQRSFNVATDANYSNSPLGGLSIPEKTDFIFRALSVQNPNANIAVTWDMLLVKN